MIFPGYVTMFKDNMGFIHLYFFPGIDENGNLYYRDLDLSNCHMVYKEIDYSDCSKEYIFENKKIVKILCKLVDNKSNLHNKELTL